jgi:5-methyltetrahydropteroyltriglutamate--homocysteine methyltransferase
VSEHVVRADQIGSLLRPARLLDAREAFAAGRIDRDALRKAEDAAVLEVLALQREVGIDVYGDGEMRRDSWQSGITAAVDGFAHEYPVEEARRSDGTIERYVVHRKPVERRLKQIGRIASIDAAFLRAHAPGPFKITMPSPSHVTRSSWRADRSAQAYPTREALQDDLVAIVRSEMEALVADGASYLQLDEGFNAYVNEEWRAGLAADGRSVEEQLARDVAADNRCYDAVRGPGVTVAMHLCRGSRISWLDGKGSYDWLAERLLDQLRVDRFLLEYDTALIGGFAPLRFLPKGKVVVLGLISSKKSELERRDDVLRRIDEAARVVPVEQLALSTQCGFQGAADRDGAHVSDHVQRRKLELVVACAREVWG